MSAMLLTMPGMTVCAANEVELNESNNPYMQGEISTESAEALPSAELYSLARGTSVTHYSSVSSSYGLISGCTLNGTCYCKLSGTKVAANYSAVSTFYHSNGDTLIGSARSGSSSSSTDFTWSSSDDTTGTFYTVSTSTDTTCSKSGYETVHITNTTENPYN